MRDSILSDAQLAAFSPRERARIEARDLDAFQARLGYVFSSASLLEEALCHASFSHEHGLTVSNERLEFLGDSVLSFIAARSVFAMYPDASEGEMTSRRAKIVCGRSLTERAKSVGIESALLTGMSMTCVSPSMLEDAMEAVIGAVYLDGGIDAADALIKRLFLSSPAVSGGMHPKSLLQMKLQELHLPQPSYSLVSVTGPSHSPVFTAEAHVGMLSYRASGRKRSEAEGEAASAALDDFDNIIAALTQRSYNDCETFEGQTLGKEADFVRGVAQ